MFFRYSFPVARHGELLSVTRYVDSDHNPTRKDLLTLFRAELGEAKSKATEINSEAAWREVKNIEGCIYALDHVKHPDMPHLPTNGLNDIPIFCTTEVGPSTIRVTLINPLVIEPPRLRLAVGD